MQLLISQRTRASRFAVAILSLSCLAPTYAAEPAFGRFELTNHEGKAVSEASFNGKYRLVFFGFTRCPVVCPTTMFEVTRIMKMLGDRADRVQPLFITIDPDNDTVAVVASYVRHFHPSAVGLTGNKQQIADAAKSFNVTYGGTEGSSTEIYHSSYLYLMNEDGSFLDVFGYGDKAETIVETLDKYLSSPDRSIRIIDPWASKPVGATASAIAGFMCIQNDSSLPIRIVGASSKVIERVEIHEIVHEQGIVRMRKAGGVDVAANSTVCLEPDHFHFMLFGIDDAVRAGADIRLQIDTVSGDELIAVLRQRELINAD